jgi:hypothetical protein
MLGLLTLNMIDILFGQVQLVEQLPDAVRVISAAVGAMLGFALVWWMVNSSEWWARVPILNGDRIRLAIGLTMIPPFGALGASYAVRQAVAYSAVTGSDATPRLVMAPVMRTNIEDLCSQAATIRAPLPRARHITVCVTVEARQTLMLGERRCFAMPVIEGRGGVMVTRLNRMTGANYGAEDFVRCDEGSH